MSLDQNSTQEYWQKQEMQAPDWWELLVEGDYGDSRPRRGEIFLATILSIDERDIIVDIGGKQDGIIQERDLVNVPTAYREDLKVRQRVPVRVITFNATQGSVIVSLKQGLEPQDWLRAEELMESGEAVKSEINGINRGGVVASFGPLQGFIPNSHLTRIPRGTSGEQQLKMKEALIGQTVNVLVIEVDARRRRLILSERLAAVHQRAELLAEIHEGAIRSGVVSNIVDFGAFIDLGGVDGLLHISEISWDHVGHPSDNLSIGDQIEVYVLDVDRDRERIALSRKRLLPDPWNTVTDSLKAGDVTEGTVTHTTDFGAFIDIGSGVEGLAHVSEMPNGEQGLAVLASNTVVKVKILHIDAHQRRVSLRIESDDSAVEEAEPDSSQDEPETVE